MTRRQSPKRSKRHGPKRHSRDNPLDRPIRGDERKLSDAQLLKQAEQAANAHARRPKK